MTTTETKMTAENKLNGEQPKQPVPDAKAEWLGLLDQAVKSPGALASINMPLREPIIGNWFKQGDLGFIYGPRGLGKTWLGMFLARKCAEGASLGGLSEWNVYSPRRVLYVDGEMAMDEIRERDATLSVGVAPGLYYLQHEALFHLTGRVLNLTEPVAQAAVLEKCRRDKIEILILDNLSCLFPGLRENGADSWDQVLPWLLELRRNRIAVIFIAHAGRNGAMRGTSRREDAAVWIISLTEPKDVVEVQQGARFIARFVKTRSTAGTECPSLEWTFLKPPGAPKVHVTWKKLSASELFSQCLELGMCSAKDIAKHMGLTPARVSQIAKKAMKDG
jgi:AAA domain